MMWLLNQLKVTSRSYFVKSAILSIRDAQFRNVILISENCLIISLATSYTNALSPMAKLVEHRAAMWEVMSSTPAGPTLRVFK